MKAALLILIGIRIFKMVHGDIASQAEHLVTRLGLDPGSRHINQAIEKLIYTPPHKIRELGIGSFFYAGLFFTEGIGLWMLKRWAEWFTVIITSSLIPFELYEMFRHPTPLKAGVIVVNIAIAIYLIYRIRHDDHIRAT
jgi:uncharacterized membrane protein (DUF2068 family)